LLISDLPMFASGPTLRSSSEAVIDIRSRLSTVVTRFAPAPTGALHLGHAVNAIYVWGIARALGGRVVLRIEDHDRQRARAEAERSMLDDLDWLGFTPDLYPTDAYRRGSCDGRQSERDQIYRDALAPLVAAGLVYGCTCTRASQAALADEPHESARSAGEKPYAGACRQKGIALTDGVGWRLRLESGAETFDDALLGVQEQDPSTQCGDLLLRDRLGNWTYQFVATVDDAVQGITLVVRGQDLLASTGRQFRLARLIGRVDPPVFAHHPLIMKTAAQKLSKSDGDSGIRDLRAAGWSPADVIGYAAALSRIVPVRRPLRASDLPALFAP
jgi:glutamyl/glutaminyl-tRNA synthetase